MGVQSINFASFKTAAGGGGWVSGFLAATGIVDGTIVGALNDLYDDLDAAGLLSKFHAIYPFVGGDATKHSYNLVDASLYQITWNGTVTHDVNGMTGNGSTGYGNTGIIPSTDTALNDFHLSLYSRTNNNVGYEFFAHTGTSSAVGMATRSDGAFLGYSYRLDDGNAQTFIANSDGRGFYLISRTSATAFEAYKNGTSVDTKTSTNSGTRPSVPLFLGAFNNNGTAIQHSTKNLAFASVGSGLSDTEAADYYTAVQAFQTALSRNV